MTKDWNLSITSEIWIGREIVALRLIPAAI
jgi:hypothetical protein